MTPELRAALRRAIANPADEYDREETLDAIAPIIDAAIAEAVEDVIYLDWAPNLRRDALLAAADDLEQGATDHVVLLTADWLRARANEGNPA